ncbi:hypothetical protein F2Q69_00036799 [Brassica cretica]|uniref:Uncharacterized protein n=1 Tax=Brassica cretica TaxID=69181 RepID=A0A8S9SF96_BRACR|nr:hypothetical protein F2Q69_00036799 [Brassica cretica]
MTEQSRIIVEKGISRGGDGCGGEERWSCVVHSGELVTIDCERGSSSAGPGKSLTKHWP